MKIRTTCGAWRTLKQSKRDVKRGHARWMPDGRLEIIRSESGNVAPIAVHHAPALHVVPFTAPVSVGDSGMSIFPHIGYNRSTRKGMAA